MTTKRKIHWGDGCGYLLALCVLTCCLFVVNGMMAGVLFVRLRAFLPEWAGRARYAQLFLLAVPVAMIFVEWYAFDWIVNRLRRRAKSSSTRIS